MNIYIYLLIMAITTYLIRAIPFVAFTKKIKSPFFKGFLHYIPMCVLSAMTFPAILYSTNNTMSAYAGTFLAILLAYFKMPLMVVSLASAAIAYLILLFF